MKVLNNLVCVFRKMIGAMRRWKCLKRMALAFGLVGGATLSSLASALVPATVAIYNDTGYAQGGAWSTGINSIKDMLYSYGYSYVDITPGQINSTSNLKNYYQIILFPGGWAGGYNTVLNNSGRQNIRNFVSSGGGYFGICAGAFHACDIVKWTPNPQSNTSTYNYPLNLYMGKCHGSINEIISWTQATGCSNPAYGAKMTNIKVNTSQLQGVNYHTSILYYGGSYFTNTGNATIMARYNVPGSPAHNKAAMILYNYGSGKVFLSGPHPEVAMNGCTLYYNSNNWWLMHKALQKLL